MKYLALILLASPALAEGRFQPPTGCEGVMTVQARDCTVSNYYTCAAEPEGHINRVDISENGIYFFSRTDAEGRWVNSMSFISNENSRLGDERDPGSLTELLDTGVDSFDFDMDIEGAAVETYRGYDTLEGGEIVLDGVRLLRTKFEMTVTNPEGELLWRSEGSEYVSPQWRVFIGGTSTMTTPDDSFDRDGTPVQFDLPGDPGFMASKPIHGCSVNMAALRLPVAQGYPQGETQ